MPQTCRVCAHSKTKEIEDAIIQGLAHTRIGRRYGVSHYSVTYHSDNHLSEKLVKAVKRKDEQHAEDILSGIKDLLHRTNNILDEAEEKNQKRLALDAIKEARSTYELLSKIAVKLEEYRRKDEEKETNILEKQINEGLKVLTDEELNAFIQLVGKIHSGSHDTSLDPAGQLAVDALNTFSTGQAGTDSKHPQTEHVQTAPDYDSVGFTASQDQNTAKTADDDLGIDFDDLEFEDLNDDMIPSEETDPEWLKKERKRYH